jgi:hypothetical protein
MGTPAPRPRRPADPIVAGFWAALALILAIAGTVAVLERNAIRAWLERAYPPDRDLSAVERTLRDRYGAASVSVSWTSSSRRRAPGDARPISFEGRRRVLVQITNSTSFPEDATRAAIAAWSAARSVRDGIGVPVPAVEVSVWRNVPGTTHRWKSRSHWFTPDQLAADGNQDARAAGDER